jgi:23S rRNA (adenine2030-N6)-methyltransferase
MYALAPTGEWTEGIGRLWADDGDLGASVGRYLALCRSLGAGGMQPERYPGSPIFARAVLGPLATLALWESDAKACRQLTAQTSSNTDADTLVTCGDGLAELAVEVSDAEPRSDSVVALIDPPFTRKLDWTTIPDALARAVEASGRACFLLWYPVKSLARPNAMIARLRGAGVRGSIAELITTPLEHQRNRLNGSGVLLVRPPEGSLEAIAAAAPVVGSRCATHAGSWSFRLVTW